MHCHTNQLFLGEGLPNKIDGDVSVSMDIEGAIKRLEHQGKLKAFADWNRLG